jgi:4-hydroxy 2-oxovalerate aldolase
MSRLDIDTIELGYCNLPRPGYFGQYYFLTEATTRKARQKLAPSQRLAVMLDLKAIEAESAVELLLPHKGVVDIVRIAAPASQIPKAEEVTRALTEHGFLVGLNIMYLSTYWKGFADLPGLASILPHLYAVSLVDSYGACDPSQVATAIADACRIAPDGVAVGFHGHDNMGLAFANSIAALGAGASIVDGTITGMGRGPGNTRSEMLLVQRALGGSTTTSDCIPLEDVLRVFGDMQKSFGWGTNLIYMLSGAAGLPQNAVMDWIGKNRYTTSAIIQALHGDHPDNIDDKVYPYLEPGEHPASVIIIGGGPSVAEHATAILEYARRTGAVVVHANYRHLSLLSHFTTTQYVCLAGDVSHRLPLVGDLTHAKSLVVPSAPRFQGTVPNIGMPIEVADPFALSRGTASLGPISDIGPLELALGVALRLNPGSIDLVGFDGYLEANLADQQLAAETQALLSEFIARNPEILVSSATRTLYDVPVNSIYSRLSAAPAVE